MELDELKHQLKNKLAEDHAGRTDADIAALLSKKTVSVIGKLKRSLRIEIGFSILVILVFGLIGLFGLQHWLRVYFSVFAVLSAAFLVLLVYLLQRTAKLGGTALPVKSNLQTIVNIIEEFSKRYFQFTMALIPICFIFSLALAYNDPSHAPHVDRFARNYFAEKWKVLSFIGLYVILLAIGIYYFTKWYLRKLYGKYVIRLKECIIELGDE